MDDSENEGGRVKLKRKSKIMSNHSLTHFRPHGNPPSLSPSQPPLTMIHTFPAQPHYQSCPPRDLIVGISLSFMFYQNMILILTTTCI
jgi:hypothetical protein